MYNAMNDDGYTIQLEGLRNRNIALKFIGNKCYKHIISRNTILAQMEYVYGDESTNEYFVDVSYISKDNLNIVISILRKIGFKGSAYVCRDYDCNAGYTVDL